MTLVQTIQAQIVALQAKLAILNLAPTDTYPFGTMVVFSPQVGPKWFYFKTAEESWRDIHSAIEKPLNEWILAAKESPVGYFEVYVLITQASPIYASA